MGDILIFKKPNFKAPPSPRVTGAQAESQSSALARAQYDLPAEFLRLLGLDDPWYEDDLLWPDAR